MEKHLGTKLARHWRHFTIAGVLLAFGLLTFGIPILGAAGAAPYGTGPQVTITDQPPNPSTSSTGSFAFTTLDDNYPNTTLTTVCQLDSNPVATCTTPVAYANLANGSHTFTVSVSDPSGALAQATYTWMINPAPGYWLLRQDGFVYSFGPVQCGTAPTVIVGMVATDMVSTPDGRGYWVVDTKGNVYTCGDAATYGGAPTLASGEKVTSISGTADGKGYWLFTSLGRVLPYGDAPFLGDMSKVRLNGPVIGSVATPSGNGYYMVATDGGIFTFGDASFTGSMGGQHLNKPVVGLAPNPSGPGYWLVASDGGIFAFGPPFKGSMGSVRLNQPVVGMVAYGDGYLMVASDGGIFDFSSSPFQGSLGGNPPSTPIVAVAPGGRP